MNRHALEKFVLRTPLIPLDTCIDSARANIYLKPENLQPFGSYKIRGIASVVSHYPETDLEKGLAAASAGNMGQTVAFAAQQLKIPCQIYVPESAPAIKKNMIQQLGADLVQLPFDEIWGLVNGDNEIKDEKIFIHPACSEPLLKGYASIAAELIEDMPTLDAVIIPFGVGGLCRGIGRALRNSRPDIAIYTCEPETAAPLKASLALGTPVSITRIPSFVDAIGTPEVLPQIFCEMRSLINDSIVVSLDQIRKAIQILFYKHKLLCEGAAACSLAAAMQLSMTGRFNHIACILTGGNISLDTLNEIMSCQREPY